MTLHCVSVNSATICDDNYMSNQGQAAPLNAILTALANQPYSLTGVLYQTENRLIMCFITINFKFNLFDYNNLQEITPLLNVFIVAVLVGIVFVVIREGGRLFFAPSVSANYPVCYKKPIPEENEENSAWKVRKTLK